MRMNKTSRLLAVLLALLLALGSAPAALADGLVISSEQYAELSDAAVQEFYDRLMATTTLEEFDAVSYELNDEQIVAFFDKLSVEQQTALDAKANALIAEYEAATDVPAEEVEDEREIVYPTVNYTNVAPFKAPVVGTAQTRMMLLAASEEETDNGLEVDKYVSEPDEDGVYTLTLEAWATGAKVTTTQETSIPTDIVLVLDQSGSMDDSFTSIVYNAYTASNNAAIYTNRNSLYVKRSDNSYAPITVTYTTVATGGIASYAGETNSTYYSNRGEFFHKCDDTKYGLVSVSRGGNSWNRTYTYTYTCANGCALGTRSGADNTPDFADTFYTATEKTNQYTISYTDVDGTIVSTTVLATDAVPNWNFYQSSSGGTTTRLAALKTAVTTFANSVATKAKGADGTLGTDDDVDHTIAVVGFGRANYSSAYLNTEVFIGATGYKYGNSAQGQYANAPQDMSTSTGVANVSASINALDAEGGTYIDLGIEMANGILNANPVPSGENRNRVVVIFTDGAPGYNGEYDGNDYGSSGDAQAVADAAMAQIATTKNTYGATVYTVGIFTGADATSAGSNANNASDTQKANYFMQRLSSNTSYPQTPSYYLSAGDANALNNIFKQISENIATGGSSITLDENAVVRDVLTEQFELPEGTKISDIKLYTAEYVDGTFEAREDWESIEATADTVSISDKTIEVTGFDFAENWVGTEKDSDGNVTAYHGKKLIIEIPIVVREGFLGGNGVLTNAEGSGVYEDKDATEALDEFVSPSVNVPIQSPTVDLEEKNVYLYGDLTQEELITRTVDGETVSSIIIKDANGNPLVDGDGEYITSAEDLEDWQTQYATIVITKPAAMTDLTEDQDEDVYYASVVITPTVTTPTSNVGTAATVQNVSDQDKVNVFKPVLTFEDTVRDYMADVTGYDYDKQNLVSTKWMHGTTEADTTMGTAPTLTLTPDNEESTWITDNKVTGLNDVAVNMRVAIGGTDVTAYTTSYRNACNDSECKYAGGNGATAEFNPEFIVHIRNIYGALKVSKTVPAVTGDVAQPSADEFTFTVTFSDNKTYTYQKYNADGAIGEATSSNTFVLKNGEYVIFDKITANTTYTVVEAVNDDDYYTTNQSTITGTIVAATSADQKFTNEAAFTNTYTKLNDGNLTITKVVKDSTFTEGSKEFSFTVKLNSEDAVALKQFGEAMAAAGYTVANGEATVKITVNATDANKTKSLELNDLPVGSYTVTEAAVAGYNTTYDVQRVTVTEDGNVTVTVTNTATGIIDSIPVSKVWEDSNDTWKLRPTSVTAKLVGTKPDGTNYEHTLGTKMLSSANSWADAWTNVPMFDAEGNLITYTVDEEAVAGYTKSIEGNVITNTLNIGSLTIEKKNMQADESAIFDVEVTKGTETKVWTVVLNKNNNYTATLVGLPDGAEYEVSENEAWSWSYSLDAEKTTGAKGAIEAGEVKVASFENTKNEQWLYDESSAVNKFVGTNN